MVQSLCNIASTLYSHDPHFFQQELWSVHVLIIYLMCVRHSLLFSHFRPFNLKMSLALWNLSLSIVSIIGAVRVGTHLLYLISPWGGYSFRDTICEYVPQNMSVCFGVCGGSFSDMPHTLMVCPSLLSTCSQTP